MTWLPDSRTNGQEERNKALLASTTYMRDEVTSQVLNLRLQIDKDESLSDDALHQLRALEIAASRTAIESVGELAKIGEVDHLGGGLDMIGALTMTLAMTDYEKVDFTLENAHASIGYYSALAALGFLDREDVIKTFRQGLDIPGHVSWVPGGTQLNGGRLGVMIPTAVGQALGRKARHGADAWVICHCGDAGWIAGHALNGFNAADLHKAPVTFIMHRNGIQLSGSNQQIMDKDPRPIIESLGVTIIETPSLHDPVTLYQAYRKARALAREGKPSMIYPTGYRSTAETKVDLNWLGSTWNIEDDVKAICEKNGIDPATEIWVPGAMMSFRDAEAMLECILLVNNLPGGKGHHDGHMKGRDVPAILNGAMLQLSKDEAAALNGLENADKRTVVTRARPAPGSKNLILSADACNAVKLPEAGKSTSPRAGVQAGYEAVAKAYPEDVFVIDCDLAPSTKTDKAKAALAADHVFELSIEEQIATIMANGIAMSTREPQLVVFATFAAFFEGIAREGMEMWRYQRNLNGINEGLNATIHMSHVGACTGRDHFSGWALDWINLGIGYLPYLHRFYAPADARAAFLAIKDLAAHSGGHIIGIPRDNLPVLAKQDGSAALWNAGDDWETITALRTVDGAKKAILAFGAPAFLGAQAADCLNEGGTPVDVQIVNGLPFGDGELDALLAKYPEGVVTIEDGIIGTEATGTCGFAGIVATAAARNGIPAAHVGIEDPRIAPSEGHMEVWEHFGITADALIEAVKSL